jgi:hypothetical protein
MNPAGRATVPHLPPPARPLLPLLCSVLLALLVAPRGVSAPSPQRDGASLERCSRLRQAGSLDDLRQEQQELQAAMPLRPSLPEVLTAAEALLACAAPDAALVALARVSPAPGEARQRWLTVRWRAAHAGLHHAEAAQSLRLLAGDDLASLEGLLLPVALASADGRQAPQQVALDLLADHLESLQLGQQAAEVLLASRRPGAATAARWGRAAALAEALPLQERDAILERALEQAAAAEAWGLVAALLDQQLAAGVSDAASRRALERRLRLGERIDDAYGEWLQRRRQADAESDPRQLLLEGQLRSPRAPGGHAAPLSPVPLSPP